MDLSPPGPTQLYDLGQVTSPLWGSEDLRKEVERNSLQFLWVLLFVGSGQVLPLAPHAQAPTRSVPQEGCMQRSPPHSPRQLRERTTYKEKLGPPCSFPLLWGKCPPFPSQGHLDTPLWHTLESDPLEDSSLSAEGTQSWANHMEGQRGQAGACGTASAQS
jgi:hypothetical protein